jgi:DNA (cytosine-5)-methyltransferase 1
LYIPVAFPWQSALDPIGNPSDISGTLIKNQTMAVAFGGDIARSLTARHDSSPCADRGMDVVAVAFGVGESPDVGHCLRSGASKADKHESTTYVAQPMAFQETADCLTAAYGTKWNGNASADNGSLYAAQPIPFDTTQITSAANYSKPQAGDPCHPLAAGAHPPAIAQPVAFALQHAQIGRKDSAGPQGKGWQEEVAFTQDSRSCADAVAVAQPVAAFKGGQGAAAGSIGYDEHVAPTLSAADSGSNRTPALLTAMQVRRLTPVECERLQGFPDNYTAIPWRKKPSGECPDGPRYKALGNSMAVPVMRWIGERIQAVDKIK